tara:strand:- start:425 stop:613 length:189 start_codon:yes stop_codon:yes gene_type:complete
MSKENIKLTQVQLDYKQHIANKTSIKENAMGRLTQIRKEVSTLHLEEANLEDILYNLNLVAQ